MVHGLLDLSWNSFTAPKISRSWNLIPFLTNRYEWLYDLYDQPNPNIITRLNNQGLFPWKEIPFIFQPESSEEALGQINQDDQIQNQAAKEQGDKQIVDNLVKKSNRCIISISSLFPWSFSRNTIEVKEGSVIFTFHQFLSFQSHSVDIKDISNVFIEASLFSATIQIVTRNYVQNDIKISNLNKKKAERVKLIIEGLRVLENKNINTANYEVADLINTLEELNSAK